MSKWIEAKIYKPNELPTYKYRVVKNGGKRARCIIMAHDEDEAWTKFLNYHLRLDEIPEDFDIYEK